MAVPVPQGPSTWLWTGPPPPTSSPGGWISTVALPLVTVLWLLERQPHSGLGYHEGNAS